MPVARSGEPSWKRRAKETVHIIFGDETSCGLAAGQQLQLIGLGDDELDGYEARADSCRRCIAALRWFVRELNRDSAMRHPPTPEHRSVCYCGAVPPEPGVYGESDTGWVRIPNGEEIVRAQNGITYLLRKYRQVVTQSGNGYSICYSLEGSE